MPVLTLETILQAQQVSCWEPLQSLDPLSASGLLRGARPHQPRSEAWGLQHNPDNEVFNLSWAEKKVFSLLVTSSLLLCRASAQEP